MIRCLYVDDEPGLLEITKEFLELKNDIDIAINDSPTQVNETLAEMKYDIIISDYQMPEMNGIEFFKAIRTKGIDVPFILFTGKGREEVAINALNSGIDFYLKKGGDPLSQFAELENVIRQIIRRKEAENALTYNMLKFKHIIENILDMVIIIDKDGTINYASPSVFPSLGYKSEEMIGLNAFSFLHPDDPDVRSSIESSVGGVSLGSPFEMRLRQKDGRLKWFEGTVKPMPMEFGEGILIMSAWDIDERKRMETEIQNRESTLRAVFDNSGEYIMIISLDGEIMEVNRNLCESSGFTKDELVGSEVINLIAPSNREHYMTQVRRKAQRQGGNEKFRIVVSGKGGIEKHLVVSSQLVRNLGEKPFVVVSGMGESL